MTKTTLQGSILTVTRRFAAGIDVSEKALRLAVLSRRLRANGAVCVEHLETVPLDPGVVIGGDFIDRPAISAALRDAFGRLPPGAAWRGLRCAMALPAATTLTTLVPLARLMPPFRQGAPYGVPERGDPRGLLEPAVLAEAERAVGIERTALSVDWSVEARDDGHAQVSISATPRQHIEARVETAAAAGVALSAIDGEPGAALRAMRHAGSIELGPNERYVACWVESGGLHAWLIGDEGSDRSIRSFRYPSPEYSTLVDAFHDLIGQNAALDWILVSGDLDLLARAGLPAPQLAERFGCPVLPFECAPFCNGAARIDEALRHSPLFAVAFGLALREVTQ